jgi:hypothetical protein
LLTDRERIFARGRLLVAASCIGRVGEDYLVQHCAIDQCKVADIDDIPF